MPYAPQDLSPDIDPDDYWCWLRLQDLDGWEDDTPARRQAYLRSRRRGKCCAVWDRKRDRIRRRECGPGKFHASSPTGWYLNKNFVKGWRGVNPANP